MNCSFKKIYDSGPWPESPKYQQNSDIYSNIYLILKIAVKNCFIRGSVVRQVQVPKSEVDIDMLQDAARRDANKEKTGK